MTATEPISVKPLTADRFKDLATLFNQGGDPKWCWCMYYRKRGMNWANSSPANNRRDLQAIAGSRPDVGLIAYLGKDAVGWVSLAPRESYDRLESSKLLAPVDDVPVWSIVCFVVSAKARGQGIASALLAAAIEHAKRSGASTLEAYPVADARGRVPPASAFHGVQSMFEKAGFKVVAVRQWNKTSPPRPIMRLELA